MQEPEVHDVAAERDLIDNPPQLLCAWHQKYFAIELIMREGQLPASHGICPDCLEKMRREGPFHNRLPILHDSGVNHGDMERQIAEYKARK